MTPVSSFAQYLLRQDPQRNPARLTLFNYLKHVIDPETPMGPEVLAQFYGRVLQFDFWRGESANLAATVRSDLNAYLKQNHLVGDWGALRHPDTLQIVPLRLAEDLSQLIQIEHAARLKAGVRLKTIAFSDGDVLALLLDAGGLEAKVYPSLAMVWGPTLRLVAPKSHLHYGADFELLPKVRQVLSGSLVTTHAFQVDFDGASGLITRGHTFQKFETFIRAKLSDIQDLFASLKRVERHFIDAQTDPYYQELITRLERANRLLGHPSPVNLMEAERALGRGRQSLKHIFPDDRLLTLLVTHLDYGISQRRVGQGQSQGQAGRKFTSQAQ